VSGNVLVALGALVAACLFAAGTLFRSWRRRRTRPPLIAAIAVVVLGAAAVVLSMLGVPYKLVVGPAFIAAMIAVLVSARTERGTR
jgi:peptidoglycan/LPS O-acetylase OafA/YrhL